MKKLKKDTVASKTYSDRQKRNRPVNVPIFQTTNFEFTSSQEIGNAFKSKIPGVYTRFGHPTLNAVSEKIAQLEGAEKALVFSSGMGAITTTLISLLQSGDHVIAHRKTFPQTYSFLDQIARKFGVEIDFIDVNDHDLLKDCIKRNTKLIHIDSPSNPLLEIVDIQAISEMVKGKGIYLTVDSTFASPFLQNPLELGADVVLHSATKVLGGHSDIMCGAAAGSDKLIRTIFENQILLGNILDPHSAFLLLRGIKTLGVRIEKMCKTALKIAKFLSEQKCLVSVNYPTLPSSPNADVAARQMKAGGWMVTFEADKGLEGARTFVNSLELIPVATSLGGTETIIEVPYELDFSEEELNEGYAETEINKGHIRLSVGLEDENDLIEDLQKGIKALYQYCQLHENELAGT